MTARNITLRRRYSMINLPSGQLLYMPADDTLSRLNIPSEIDPYEAGANQEYPLGSRLEYGEEVYRYAKCGSVAVEIAALVQAVVPLAGHINEAIDVPAVGGNVIYFTPNTVTTDDLAENALAQGYIFIYDNTGEGAKYRIKSHPAIVGAVSGALTLYDPIRIEPAAASTATVMHNKYRAFLIHPSPPTAIVLGWTVAAVTGNYYCWLQTKGPCCTLIDGVVVMGGMARASEDDDGAVAAVDRDEAARDEPMVGIIMEIGADAAGGEATYGFINAMLE